MRKEELEAPWQETERLAFKALQAKGYYVLNYNTGMAGAPVHRGGDDVLITPDLDFLGHGVRAFGEVKCKAIASHYRITGLDEHGISQRHYAHYRKIEYESGMPVWLFIRQLDTDVMHYANLRGWLNAFPRWYHGTKMGPDGMVFWPVHYFRTVRWPAFVAGDWDDSIIKNERWIGASHA